MYLSSHNLLFLGRRTVAVVCFSAAACATNPDSVVTVSQTKTPIAKTITSFSQAKSCMDQLFLETGRRRIKIGLDEIPDRTNSVSISAESMIRSTLSDMSRRSEAFRIFAAPQGNNNLILIQEEFYPIAGRDNVNVPGLFIGGAVSQADDAVTMDEAGASIATPWASLGYSENQIAGTIALDLFLGDMSDYSVISGVTTSNIITIVDTGDSTSARGLISGGSGDASVGLSVSLDSSQREGRSQAMRTLIEFSVIELMGKYSGVPYARCFELQSTDPQTMQTARAEYDALDPAGRARAIQAALVTLGEYAGPTDGLMTVNFQAAITRAKAARGLIANGRIDFQLFNALFNENALPALILARAALDPAVAPSSAAGPGSPTGRDPVGLNLSLTTANPRIGEALTFEISAQAPAQAWCYYEFTANQQRQTVRIFPNRFQPDNRLQAGQTVQVPSPDAGFQIRLSSDGEEAVGCVATTATAREATRVDVSLQPDLEPLSCGYPGVACPIYQHQQADTLNTSAKRITYRAAL